MTEPAAPPMTRTHSGQERRVGVELEFAGVRAIEAADIVQAVYGGTIQRVSAHRCMVKGTDIGDFRVELDTRFAHPETYEEDFTSKGYDKSFDKELQDLGREFDALIRETVGDAVSGVVPTEIVCPPVPWHDLSKLDGLVERLRRAGAQGTDENPLYGFGLHLNPEAASLKTSYVLAHLRAYFLCNEWLRQAIDVDWTRRLLPHSAPFPKKYMLYVLNPGYNPAMTTLIRDYIVANPTRNRELDMLPLFAEIDQETVHSLIEDPRIKARPTFHYRLPNAQFSDPLWGIVREWNRWVEIERLASDEEELHRQSEAFIRRESAPFVDKVRRWFEE